MSNNCHGQGDLPPPFLTDEKISKAMLSRCKRKYNKHIEQAYFVKPMPYSAEGFIEGIDGVFYFFLIDVKGKRLTVRFCVFSLEEWSKQI